MDLKILKDLTLIFDLEFRNRLGQGEKEVIYEAELVCSLGEKVCERLGIRMQKYSYCTKC